MPRRISKQEAEALLAQGAVEVTPRRVSKEEADALMAQGAVELPPGTAPDSPLAKALASQPGDVVTVETPTGPAQFGRGGQRVMTAEDMALSGEGGAARFKEDALKAAVSTLSGTTGGGFADELLGGARALPGYLAQKLNPMAAPAMGADERYRKERDAIRKEVGQATRDVSPRVKIPFTDAEMPVLPVTGAVLSAGPLGSTVPARIVGSGVLGALSSAGQSEADLTQGGEGQFARDVGVGGATGLAAGGVGELVRTAARPVSRWISDRAVGVYEQGANIARRPVERARAAFNEAVESLGGAARSETQKGSRILENVQRGAGGLTPAGSGPAAVNPALQGRAALALSSPEARQLAEGVLENSLESLPQQTARMANARSVAEAMRAAAPAMQGAFDARGTEAAARYFADPARPIGTFLRSQVPRQAFGAAVGGTLYGAGELADSDALKLAGGAAYGSIAGAPGFYRAAQNLYNSPAAQHMALGVAEGAFQSGVNNFQRAAMSAVPAANTAESSSEREERARRAFLANQ